MAEPKIAVIFYSTYGTNHAVAEEAATAARAAGAEVRLRRVAETAPDAVVQAQEAWAKQLAAVQDIPEVSHDDIEWADGYFISAPTRFGNAPSQLRAFIDGLGPLWQQGKLANKTFTATPARKTPMAAKRPRCCRCTPRPCTGARSLSPPDMPTRSSSRMAATPRGFRNHPVR